MNHFPTPFHKGKSHFVLLFVLLLLQAPSDRIDLIITVSFLSAMRDRHEVVLESWWEKRRQQLNSWVPGKFHWRRDSQPTPGFLGFPCDSAGKESTCNVGDLDSIPGLVRTNPREGKGYPLQYSDLENSVDCIVHGVSKSQTQLSNFHSQLVTHWIKK